MLSPRPLADQLSCAHFSPAPDPARYVARPATEAALAELEKRVMSVRGVAVLSAPGAMGKTLLLRVLALRMRGTFRVVPVPVASLGAADLCSWVLDALGEPSSEDPELALACLSGDAVRGGGPLLIAIDDAENLPFESAQRLGALVDASGGGLRVVAAVGEDTATTEWLRALGAEPVPVSAGAPMTRGETGAYVRERLAGAPDAVRAWFDPATVDRLHEESGGVPGLARRAAQQLLRDRAGTMPAVEAAPAPRPPVEAVATTLPVPVAPAGAPADIAAPAVSPARLAWLVAELGMAAVGIGLIAWRLGWLPA